jgi:hypothetical protein
VIAAAEFLLLLPLLAGFGLRVGRWMGAVPARPAEQFALGAAFGFGALTLLVFALAVARVVGPLACAALALLMLSVSLCDTLGLLRALRSWLSARGVLERLRPRRDLNWWATATVVAVLALGAVQALAPPTGIDAGAMHFAAPKLMLREGGLSPAPEVWFHRNGGFYMVYLFGMALGGEILAKLLAFGAAVAVAPLAWAVGERVRSGCGPLASFLVVGSPLVTAYVGYEFLELPALLYLLAATLALEMGARDESPGGAVAACALAGCAVAVKSSMFAAGLFPPVAWILLARRHDRSAWPRALWGLALFAAAAGCWPVWNKVTVGSWFYTEYWGSSEGPLPLSGAGAKLAAFARMAASLLVPTFMWPDSAGPFLIAGVFGAVLFCGDRGSRRLSWLLLASVSAYSAVLGLAIPGWLSIPGHGRYLAPFLLALGGPVAASFAGWARGAPRPFRILVTVALFLMAGPLILLKAGKAAVAAPAAFGLESRSAYLSKKVETFAACERLNGLPDPEVRVLFLGDRPYYLDRPFVGAEAFRGVRGREEFLRRARELRLTHVLHEPVGAGPPWISDPEAFFGPAPFVKLGEWPYGPSTRRVRLYRIEPP